MATRVSEVKKTLDEQTNIQNENAIGASPANQVFRAASMMLALTCFTVFGILSRIYQWSKVKVIGNENLVQLVKFFIEAYHKLKIALRRREAGDLKESEKAAIEDSEGAMREIEQPLRRRRECDEENHVLRIERAINTFHTQCPLLDEGTGVAESVSDSTNADVSHATKAPSHASGEYLSTGPPFPIENETGGTAVTEDISPSPDLSSFADRRLNPVSSGSQPLTARVVSEDGLSLDNHHDAATTCETACERLIRHEFAPHGLSYLSELILSSESKPTYRLPLDDAETLIEALDEALQTTNISTPIRQRCLELLYKTCSHHTLLPKSIRISTSCDKPEVPFCRGGYADVWKGEYLGHDVAVKTIRVYTNSDLKEVTRRFCKEVIAWKFLQHPNILPLIGATMSENQFMMFSDWMENGDIIKFVKTHPDTNRLRLLLDVSVGLDYLHGNGLIHGDLKGANILIDEASRACLTDFGLLTTISDPTSPSHSNSIDPVSTTRWMSPEIVFPEEFGLKNSRRTKSSDCYALGMVIYETISGDLPFYEDSDAVVLANLMRRKHPTRSAGFSDNIWRMVTMCWAPVSRRLSVEDVVRLLELELASTQQESSPPSVPSLEHGGSATDTNNDTEIPTSNEAPPLGHKMAAYKRLIGCTFEPSELPSLVEEILLSEDETQMIYLLPGEDAQAIIDNTHKALQVSDLSLPAWRDTQKFLYKTSGRLKRLPKALQVSVIYDKTSQPAFGSAGSDVWRVKHDNRDVAVKAIRISSKDASPRTIKAFFKEAVMWSFLKHPNILPLVGAMISESRFELVSYWMINGDINRYIREHPRVCRIALLVGATEGLVYLHNNGFIHGDLKGMNILVDEAGNALLADFGLLTVPSTRAHLFSSSFNGAVGTVGWMGPELLTAKPGGSECRSTKPSDCYALAMVIYEAITEKLPFHEVSHYLALVKVMKGEHPTRGPGFPDRLWKMLEDCWDSHPNNRPNAEEVLRCLLKVLETSSGVDGGVKVEVEAWRIRGEVGRACTGRGTL